MKGHIVLGGFSRARVGLWFVVCVDVDDVFVIGGGGGGGGGGDGVVVGGGGGHGVGGGVHVVVVMVVMVVVQTADATKLITDAKAEFSASARRCSRCFRKFVYLGTFSSKILRSLLLFTAFFFESVYPLS